MYYLEKKLHSTEAALWALSAIPGVNLVSGPCKAAIGVVQVIAGFAYTIFAKLASILTRNGLSKEGIKHIAHGFANILSGAAYTLPLVGNAIAIYAYLKKDGLEPWRYDEYFKIPIPKIAVAWV